MKAHMAVTMESNNVNNEAAHPDRVASSSTSNNHSAATQPHPQAQTNPPSNTSFVWTFLRSILLDLPLALLFASFLIVYSVKSIHDTYYRPLFDRAQRTDLDLSEEFTYYQRQCTEYDLTTRNIQDLFVNASAPVDTAVDQMLTHGAMVIPNVLKKETVQRLRNYVVARNAAVSEAEQYPVSQGHNRLSYGIDATENEAVAGAIQEIANHPLFPTILKNLLGDPDPASAEITAITAYAGSPDQAWHADTKGDGNALKFARTYSHSYSFFLPLQDTTAAMGATDICPGTHYCANDIDVMCEATKMGLNQATPEQVFRAGDGALINQHVWHRGSAHTDPSAPERIVFIMSFLARPKLNDPRQLSRGTYFHQKWLMWGHTFKDLTNPMLSMRKPFSILRCMSLWKPRNYNWGYDLVTSGFMRFSNDQLEDDDLEWRFLPRLDQLGFPQWLRGTVPIDGFNQKEAWSIFLQETIEKTFRFLEQANLWAHGAYLLLVVLLQLLVNYKSGGGGRRFGVLRRATFSVLLTHVILLGLTIFALERVRTSDWGVNVLSGKMLMRPFPPVSIPRQDEAVMVSSGPTTLPERDDVLIGSRYDAKFLGSYDRWLGYHPGNVLFRKLVSQAAPIFASHDKVDPLFARRLVQHVEDVILERDGRFLQQDYRTGDWRVMTKEETCEAILNELVASSSDVTALIRKEIDWAMADYRFGLLRGTALARAAQLRLWNLKKRLLGSSMGICPSSSSRMETTQLPMLPWELVRNDLPSIPSMKPINRSPAFKRSYKPSSEKEEFREGSLVWVEYPEDDVWYPGTILEADENFESFRVSYEDGSFEADVELDRIRKKMPLVEGDSVEACFELGLNDCFPGTILRIMPSGDASILFDDNDIEWRMSAEEYYTPPYRYPQAEY